MSTKLLAESDHRPVIAKIRDEEGEAAVETAIRLAMGPILRHCIVCDWGACYNTKFKELVWPYLDDVRLLDELLRSEIIRPTGDLLVGRTGARIFPELLQMLSRCEAGTVRRYLDAEFA